MHIDASAWNAEAGLEVRLFVYPQDQQLASILLRLTPEQARRLAQQIERELLNPRTPPRRESDVSN